MRCHISFMLVLCAVTGLLFAATASGQTALNPAGRVAACPANPPVAGVDGWHVKIYTSVSNRDNQLVHAAHGLEGASRTAGALAGEATAEPDINFADQAQCAGHVAGERQVPGVNGADNYGGVFTGWICFPEAKSYRFNVSSDDGFSCIIGTGKTNQVVGYFSGGRGCDYGTDFEVVVQQPGVYAIQLIFWDGCCGSGIEFNRIVNVGGTDTFVLVGTTRPQGMADQPLIYGTGLGLGEAPIDFLASIPGITNLNAGGRIAACPANLPAAGSDGWNVQVYTGIINQPNDRLVDAAYNLKAAIDAGNLPAGTEQAQPDVNYADVGGCEGNVAGWRQLPGLTAPAPNGTDDYAAILTGWICFPEAKTYTLNVSSDDGFAVVLGTGTTNQVVGYFDGGRGCGEGTYFTVRVASPGVYAIQLIFWEGNGGSGVELSRLVSVNNANTFVLIGTTRPAELPDQPVIYGASLGTVPIDVLAMIPPFDPGPLVYLDKNGAESDAAGLSSPGWDVTTYPNLADNLDGAKASLGYDYANGKTIAAAVGEPDLNYNDDGAGSACNIGADRFFPGLIGGGHDYYATVAKGWIQFPPDDGSNPYPRSYALNLTSDDGFEVLFGTGKTNQVVKYFATSRGCPGDADPASIFNLVVQEAGVYAIQIIQYEMAGGSNLEFFRRVASADPRLTKNVLVGAGGTGDQPLVFGLKNGKPAPDLLSTYAPYNPGPVVTLSPNQKVAGTGTGDPVFSIKTVQGPITWESYYNYTDGIWYTGWVPHIHHNRDDYGDSTALKFLDALADMGGVATTATINFRGLNGDGTAQPDGPIPNGINFFGMPNQADEFAMRAEGFATFPAPGIYILGVDSDDDAFVRFGKQTVYSTGCCPNRVFQLNVPEAGTYPVRVELIEGMGDARIDFYEFGTVGRASVNAPGSSFQIHQSATSGPYAWATSGVELPAARKVANVGQGDTLGWNATLSKEPDPLTALSGMDRTGLGTALNENDLYGIGSGIVPQATDTPDSINYVDSPDTNGRFANDRNITSFGDIVNSSDYNDFNITAVGYIEFPAAGDYALNTNCDDGFTLWVAGKIVSIWPFTSGATDNTVAVVRVTEPGLYDIRMDCFDRNSLFSMELYQYLPDRSLVLVNDPAATVKVYRTLKSAPLSTAFANPVRIPAALKVAGINRGGDRGFHVQVVEKVITDVNADGGGVGHDKLHSLAQASELLDDGLGIAPSLSQKGNLVADTVVDAVNFPDGDDGTKATGFPGPPNKEDFAVRVTGLLALKAGGHLFDIPSDDGFNFYIGDYHVGQAGPNKGNSNVQFYVYVPEDGLYPFKLEHMQRCCGKSLVFNEIEVSMETGITIEPVNTGTAMKAYVNLSPCAVPFADADKDGDVDQADFGAFQACFSGEASPANPVEITGLCRCFDRDNDGAGDGDVDATDFIAFWNCFTGPTIKWPQGASSNCVP